MIFTCGATVLQRVKAQRALEPPAPFRFPNPIGDFY
jgi:hypothetical protein